MVSFDALAAPIIVALTWVSIASAESWSHASSQGSRPHVDAHVDGFRLHSLFTTSHHIPSKHTTIHHRTIKSRYAAKGARRTLSAALPAFSYGNDQNSRDRVLTLMKLNHLAYPGPFPSRDNGLDAGYSPEAMRPIWEAGDSLFGKDVKTQPAEFDAMVKFHEMIESEVNETTAGKMSKLLAPQETAEFKMGVAALEFVRDDISVLVFRGTYTAGDNANMLNLMMHWVLEKMSHRLKDAWVKDANLTWDKTRYDRAERSSAAARTALQAVVNGLDALDFLDGNPLKGMLHELPAKVKEGKAKGDKNVLGVVEGYDDDMAEELGYWPITKQLVDKVYDSLAGKKLLLSGHSQGGARATFASMYIRKSKALKVPTVTFAAVGGQCSSRLTWMESGNILDDVNPFEFQDQITDYVHPLDIYGNGIDLDPGYKCLYGLKDMEESMEYKYCKEVFGYSAPNLIALAVLNVGILEKESGLNDAFRRCRYYTHTTMGMTKRFSQPGILLDDGTTDGGCSAMAVVNQIDEEERCPPSPSFGGFLQGLVTNEDDVNNAASRAPSAILVAVPMLLCLTLDRLGMP